MKIKKLVFGLAVGAIFCTMACSNEAIDSMSTESAVKSNAYSGTTPIIEMKVSNISGTKATMTGLIRYDGEQEISMRGFVYSLVNKEPYMKQEKTTTRLITEKTDSFSYSVSNLKSDTTYYARVFLIYGANKDTIYSDVCTFRPIAKKPIVTTMSIFNRTRRAAIVCGQFKASGDNLSSYGICLSEKGCPTVKDTRIAATDTATDDTYRGIFGVFFDNLKQNTLYHTRAYAITSTDTVYGEDRIFKTTAGGNFTWGFTSVQAFEDAGIKENMTVQMDSAMYYYRNYTNLQKYIYVNYSPGTPTADCNIAGWMNMGAVARYQWVGTIQHEMCHALGVGTASNWNSFGKPWDKPAAVLTLRVMMKDMTMNVQHDGMHFWPGGINQQEEVTVGTSNNKGNYTLKGDLMLKANALIINGMRTDGLTSY